MQVNVGGRSKGTDIGVSVGYGLSAEHFAILQDGALQLRESLEEEWGSNIEKLLVKL
jgi:hypothetical protein